MNGQNFSALLLNLDRDHERLTHMKTQLAAAGIVFTRLSGIVGDDVPATLRHFFFNPDGAPKTTMKRGEIGCYASHLRALQAVAAGTYGPVVLILEDDLTMAPDSVDVIAALLQTLPPQWDILRLSNPPRRAYAPLRDLGHGRWLVRYSKIPTSAGVYLVTPAGAQKFLTHGVRGLTFDDDLRRPWFHHMDSYGVVPPPMPAGAIKQSSIDAAEAGRFDKGISSNMERLQRGDYRYTLLRLRQNLHDLGVVNWVICQVINVMDMLARPLMGRSIIHRATWLFPRIDRDKAGALYATTLSREPVRQTKT